MILLIGPGIDGLRHSSRMLPRVIDGPGGGLVIPVWFPYRRWFLLVILDLSATIAFKAVLAIIYPATANTT
jgi:hypothetical protein